MNQFAIIYDGRLPMMGDNSLTIYLTSSFDVNFSLVSDFYRLTPEACILRTSSEQPSTTISYCQS